MTVTVWVFYVAASNAAGPGPWSAASPACRAILRPSVAVGVASVAVWGPGAVTATFASPAPSASSPADFVLASTSSTGSPVAAVVAMPATQVTLSSMVAGTSYRVYLAASNAAGTGPWTGAASAPVTAINLPGSAAAITPSAALSGALTFTVTFGAGVATGDASAPASGYRVAASPGGAALATTATTSGQATVTFGTASGIVGGTAYSFFVAAYNAAGTGAWSSTGSASLIAATAPPAPATPPSAGPGNAPGAVALSLSAGFDNATAVAGNGYASVLRYLFAATPGGATLAQTADGSSPAVVSVTGLTPGQAYTFYAAAVNAYGTGAWAGPSAAALAPALPALAPTVALAVTGAGALLATVTNLAAFASGTNADCGYAPVAAFYFCLHDYQISDPTPGFFTTQSAFGQLASSDLWWFVPGRRCYVAAVAANAAGWGPLSAYASAVLEGLPTAAPTLVAGSTSTTITLTLTTVANTDANNGYSPITSYGIYAWPSGALVWSTATLTGSPATTLTGITMGQFYSYYAAAANRWGSGAASATVTVATATAPTLAPALSVAQSGSLQLTLAVTNAASFSGATAANGYTPILSYVVASTSGGQAIASMAPGPSPLVAFSGLARQSYTYYVSASNVMGLGPWSSAAAQVPATTPQSAPIWLLNDGPGHDYTLRYSVELSLLNSYSLYHSNGDNGGSPITGYRIYCKKGYNGTPALVGTASSGDAMSIVATGDFLATSFRLTYDSGGYPVDFYESFFYFYIVAYNALGDSPRSTYLITDSDANYHHVDGTWSYNYREFNGGYYTDATQVV